MADVQMSELVGQWKEMVRDKRVALMATDPATARHEAAGRELTAAQERARQARQRVQRAIDAKSSRAAERDAKEAQAQVRLAQVEVRNADLARRDAALDGLLEATLVVDDYVDLDAMITTFSSRKLTLGALARPEPAPAEPTFPTAPVWIEPAPPTGMFAMFGGKKRHEAAIVAARAQFEADHAAWQDRCTHIHQQYQAARDNWSDAEAKRTAELHKVQEYHRRITEDMTSAATELKNNLAFDVPDAIETYIDMVLASSTYPDWFPVDYKRSFDLATRELTLQVTIPAPADLSEVEEFRYVKSKDEITEKKMTAKAAKDRYASIVAQVAVRTLHEVFEADRAAKISSVALSVQARALNPATGLVEQILLVLAAADRDTFTQLNLHKVVPTATLTHLGASISKSPYDLIPADQSKGGRTRGAR